MSIATLKKKTGVKYNNMSVSKPLFSLNGTYRNQGFVGQTTLSRSLPRTLIKNGGYKNYGGCCGAFPIGQIVQSSVIDTEDNTVVKISTKNTHGLLHVNTYQWIWRPAPCTSVKLDSNNHLNSQSDHIKIVQKNAIKTADSCRVQNTDVNSSQQCNTNCALTRPRYTPFKNAGKWAKPESDFVAMSQGEYLLKLDKDCSVIDDAKLAANISNCSKCALAGNR
jgi:hypothetical protein